MKFLVTGGAGFIGSHLCERLISSGHSVVVLDDLSAGSMDNLIDLPQDFLRVIVARVDSTYGIKYALSNVDGIFHLAASVGVKKIMKSGADSITNNILATDTVLKSAAEVGCKVVLASSSEVYGLGTPPFREDQALLGGATNVHRWSYASSKVAGEFLAHAYAREKGLRFAIARIFNTVGPRQISRYGMVLPSFVEKALSGDPLIVHGNGYQRRCFTHVSDTVRALTYLMTSKDADGQVVNVGSYNDTSILQLAELVIALSASKSRIEFMSYKDAYGPDYEDMEHRVPDLSRLARLTGFRMTWSLEQTILDVIKAKRGELSNAS